MNHVLQAVGQGLFLGFFWMTVQRWVHSRAELVYDIGESLLYGVLFGGYFVAIGCSKKPAFRKLIPPVVLPLIGLALSGFELEMAFWGLFFGIVAAWKFESDSAESVQSSPAVSKTTN
jgi:hypothetical protein